MIKTISIKEKDTEFINVLKNRLESLADSSEWCHDGELIVDGTNEMDILKLLLDNKEINYSEAKERLNAENSKLPMSGGQGMVWKKPLKDRFDYMWNKVVDYTNLSANELKERFNGFLK